MSQDQTTNDHMHAAHQPNLAHHVQQAIAGTFESSVGQSAEAMTQLASQVQATLGASQQMQVVGGGYQSLSLNSNNPMQQFVSMHAQSNPVVALNGLPVGWNGAAHSASASYQMPTNWTAVGQGMISQTNVAQNTGHQAQMPPLGVQRKKGSKKSATLPNMLSSMNAENMMIPPDSISLSESSETTPKGKTPRKASGGGKDSKAKQNRERNREHARSTRLRKKAYVQKLKEMAEGLRAIQTEEIRQRRLAVQKMSGIQKVRRTIVQTFLQCHANFEGDPLKWSMIVEDSFWLKQPVTPFRSFRRSEVEKDCRVSKGIDAMICDSASMSTMIERIGCRNARWQRIKRKQFLQRLQASGFSRNFLDRNVTVNPRAESSLSSSSSTESCSSVERQSNKGVNPTVIEDMAVRVKGSSKVTSSSGESTGGKKRKSGQSEDDTAELKRGQFAKSDTASSEHETAPQAKRLKTQRSSLPAKIAQSGGVFHEVRPRVELTSQGSSSPAPFMLASLNLHANNPDEIGAYYAVNEDDMIMIDDVLMCPFVFRTKNAVLCGALADCIMPGMIRANFSPANKLSSMEIVFDAMGFMQQLDGANGGEVTAQVIPGSLEMALMNSPSEARVITEAKPPFSVVHVNEAWTRLMKYSQVEVEGRELLTVLDRGASDDDSGIRVGKPPHKLEEVAKGRSACSTYLHYDKLGNSFVDFMCSFPLTNASDEISHLLHVMQELPKVQPIM